MGGGWKGAARTNKNFLTDVIRACFSFGLDAMLVEGVVEMSLETVYEKYPTQESCLARIEKIRWQRRGPRCPYCRSPHVARKKEKGRVGRWNCHGCKSSFNVLSGTVFQHTRIPLQKWFFCVALLLNGNRVLSSHELGMHLDLHQTTALKMQRRIECEVDGGGGKRLQRMIGKERCYFIRRIYRRPRHKRRGKPVIT